MLCGQAVWQQCKPGAVFVNVGRGSITDEETLLWALDAGCLSECYLDVFAEEPLPDDSRLWDHDRVTITPHVAAKSPPEGVAEAFMENLKRFMADDALEFRVDFDKGY